MATQGLEYGLRPLYRLNGGPTALRPYGKPSTDANPIYIYDMVQKVASSVSNPEGGNPLPSIGGGNLGTAGTGLWLGSTLSSGAASTATRHLVADDPDMIFVTQSDSSSAETIADLVGKNANMKVDDDGGNAQLGPTGRLRSGMVLKSSTITTTTGKDVRILGFHNTPDNPDNAPYPLLEVQIVLHLFEQQATTGV